MSVRVAVPRDIESTFNCSIPMPDAARGEEGWQEESARTFKLSPVQVLNSNYIDSVSITENGDRVLFVLSGNYQDGFLLAKYGNNGELINSIGVTQRPGYDKSEPVAISVISSTGMIAVSMAHILDAFGSDKWEFSYYSVNANLSSQTSHVNISFGGRYDNYGGQSFFRYKVFDAGIIMLARDDDWVSISDTEAVLFVGSSLPKAIPNFSVVDACIAGGSIYFLSSGSFIESGQRYNTVFIHDLNMVRVSDKVIKNISSSTFPFLKPSINSHGGLITHSLVNNILIGKDEIASQIYDLNMINIGSYKRNDEVIKSSTKRKYRCAVDATFDDPELGVNLSPPSWVDIGSANKFAVLDSNTSQRSIFNGGGFVSCSITNPVDTVGIFGLSGVQSATVSVIDGGSTLYTDTKSGVDSEFADVEVRDLVFSVPPFSNVTIRVDFTGSNVRIGRFAVGVSETIGRAVPGTELGDIDYSILEFDEFGNTRYVPRPIVSSHTFQVDVAKQKSLSVARKLQSIGGKDAIWSADVGLSEPLVAIGKCERFPITYDNPTIVSYTVKVRGTA